MEFDFLSVEIIKVIITDPNTQGACFHFTCLAPTKFFIVSACPDLPMEKLTSRKYLMSRTTTRSSSAIPRRQRPAIVPLQIGLLPRIYVAIPRRQRPAALLLKLGLLPRSNCAIPCHPRPALCFSKGDHLVLTGDPHLPDGFWVLIIDHLLTQPTPPTSLANE